MTPITRNRRLGKRVGGNRASLLLASALLSVSILGYPAPSGANTQENAVVALHARSPVTKSACTPGAGAPGIPCSSYTTTWPVTTPAFVYLVVAKADAVDGIRGLSCGIDYDDPDFFEVSWTACANGVYTPGITWPAPGNGIRLTWVSASCQVTEYGSDGVHAVAGFFYLYSYSGAEEFAIVENPSTMIPELRVADCAGAESFDIPVALAGKISFTDLPAVDPGYNPCTDCTPLLCATSSLVGTSASVPDPAGATVTVNNCSAYDETIEGTWILNGSPGASFGSVIAAGTSANYGLMLPCSVADTTEVTYTYTVAIGAGTSCMMSGTDPDTVDVVCSQPTPSIASILDVGNDQGRQVRINFLKSSYDRPASPVPILQYEAYRRIVPMPMAPEISPLATDPSTERGAPVSESSALLVNWEFVGAVPAHGESEYNMVVPTVGDSTVDNGMYWSAFFVRAATATPTVFYDSAPDSGYSRDNLSPGAPEGFTFFAPAGLRWDESPEPDFDYYRVYGSPSAVFDETAVLIESLIELTLNVQLNSHQYYHVTATDFGGNESSPSTVYNTVAVLPQPGFVPTAYSLAQSRPNPFRSTTAISFDLPDPQGSVRLRVFDIEGKLVKTLVDGPLDAGRYNIPWPGKNELGQPVHPGIYFYRIDAGGFRQTGKAVRVN